MTLPEEQLYQGVYNGIASNIDTNSQGYVEESKSVEEVNKNSHEESSGLTLICNAIENLQRRVAELEKDKELSVGRLSGNPVKSDDKGIDFFAGLKDKVTKSDEEEKVSPKSDDEDSAMGRPFCKVVKGKMLKQDLSVSVDVNDYKFPKSATYRIDYMDFFKNINKMGSFFGFEVKLLDSNRPIEGERALLCLGNIDFAVVTIKSYDLKNSIYFAKVESVRLIPSFFKLGKIFGAKTYPEFMDAIEVTR